MTVAINFFLTLTLKANLCLLFESFKECTAIAGPTLSVYSLCENIKSVLCTIKKTIQPRCDSNRPLLAHQHKSLCPWPHWQWCEILQVNFISITKPDTAFVFFSSSKPDTFV